MPSSFALVLDTTAPVIFPGVATLDDANVLRLPYTLSEQGIVAATARSHEGTEYPAEIFGDQLVFLPEAWTYGTLVVDLEDDVGNFAHLELDIRVSTIRIRTLTQNRVVPGRPGFLDTDWCPDDYRIILKRPR